MLICVATTVELPSAFAYSEDNAVVSNDICIDPVLEKWKESDNWVFVEQRRCGSKLDVEAGKGRFETRTIERDGNVVSCIIELSCGTKELHLSLYDKSGNTHYYGRPSRHGWDYSFSSPNPSRHSNKIETLFEDNIYIILFLETAKITDFTIREKDGVYYFRGTEDYAESQRRRGVKIEGLPDFCTDYTCTLTFGNSKARAPAGVESKTEEFSKKLKNKQ